LRSLLPAVYLFRRLVYFIKEYLATPWRVAVKYYHFSGSHVTDPDQGYLVSPLVLTWKSWERGCIQGYQYITMVVTLDLSPPRVSQRLVWFIHQVDLVLLWEPSTLVQWRHRTRSGDPRASLGQMWQVTRPVSITIWESWTITYLELFVVLESRPIRVDCCRII
jgi:hypothetical protein